MTSKDGQCTPIPHSHAPKKKKATQPYDERLRTFCFTPWIRSIPPRRRRRRWSLRIQVPSALPSRHPRHHTTHLPTD